MKNKSILVTAPSGAGKTTLVKKLLEEYMNKDMIYCKYIINQLNKGIPHYT